MAGHSKWANTKHRKAAQDSRKAKIFTKVIRELTVSARQNPDPAANPRLRAAIDLGLSYNMTRDTMERAIKRGSGTDAADDLQEVRYEGYGPNGVAIIVECLTNNRNRTVSEVRHALMKHGGNLGTEGAVSYLFERKAEFVFEPGLSEEAVMLVALDHGADDVMTEEDGSIVVTAAPDRFFALKNAFTDAKLVPAAAEITMEATTRLDLTGDAAQSVLKLYDALDALDDVQDVYMNADLQLED